MDRTTTMIGAALVALLMSPAAAAVEIFALHTDHAGSVVMETDKDRNITWQGQYEPYGLPTQTTPEGPGYTGHVHDQASGLVYMQQRYYDPQVGRFLSVDPIGVNATTGTNFNRYWYANNNPYNYVDPNGELAFLIPVAIIAYRAYSAYDTATSTVANVQTLTDSNASLGDKGVAAAELVGSLVGGKAGRQAAGGAARAALPGKGAVAGEQAKLNKQLASEQQLGEISSGGGTVTHGASSDARLRSADRLAADHGGAPQDYQKVSSSTYTASDGAHAETHAYRNVTSGDVVEPKTIVDPRERR